MATGDFNLKMRNKFLAKLNCFNLYLLQVTRILTKVEEI